VLRTGRPARTDAYISATKPDYARALGVGSSVGAPILVEDRVWGMLGVTTPDHPLPAAAEERLLQFTELVAVAIANAQGKAELTASRARVVAAADESRRRVQREIHDGPQQRLVQSIATLKLALEELHGPGRELVREALEHAELAAAEMSDLVRGILPASLTRGGLRAGLETLVGRLPIAVELTVTSDRLPASTETTAYLVAAEALGNVVRHAGAQRVTVRAVVEDGLLRLEIQDDGVGAAQIGTGLTAVLDRVSASDGTLDIESPPGAGTRIVARLPLERSSRPAG
jgi:signal transduction histidine kinase